MSAPATLYGWDLAATAAGVLASEAAAHAIPIGRDHLYDHKTNTFTLVGGKNPLTTGLDSIRQAVTIKLLTFLGEWFLDPTVGVAYLQEVFVKSPKANAIKEEFRSQILTVAGVLSVTSILTNFDPKTRKLTVAFTADTDFGELTGTVPFPFQ